MNISRHIREELIVCNEIRNDKPEEFGDFY